MHIGDRFRIGSAEFAVTEPRMPCYKLALRFGRPDMVKRFMKSGRTGFYLAVLKEGEIGAGRRRSSRPATASSASASPPWWPQSRIRVG